MPEAPRHIALVLDLVNTRDVESGSDALATIEGLREWLRARDLGTFEVSSADVARIGAFREAVRDLLWAARHEGHEPDLHPLEQEAARAGVGFTVNLDGSLELRPTARDIGGVIETVLGSIYTAMADGSWDRVKVCHRDSCRWAFYDQSRNRSRNWCSMAVCGNRTKAENFRERTKT